MIFPAELLLNKEDPFGIRVSSFQNSTFGLSLPTFEASPNFWVILLLSKFSKVFEPGSFRSVVITLPFNLQLLHFSRTKLLPDLIIASDVRWPFPRCRWRRCRSCRRRRRSPCTSLWTASARWRDLSSTHPASPVCPDFWRSLVRPPSWWLSLDFEPLLLPKPTWMTVTLVTLVTLTTLVSRRFPDRACFDGGRKLFYWKRKRIIHLFLALIFFLHLAKQRTNICAATDGAARIFLSHEAVAWFEPTSGELHQIGDLWRTLYRLSFSPMASLLALIHNW